MRDQQRRAALGRCKKVRDERVRGLRVEMLAWFVEDEDREVGEQRTGNRDPLTLATRQRRAVFPDGSVEAER